MSKVNNKANRCLICYSDNVQQNGSVGLHSQQRPCFLGEDLHVIFLLRTLFEIPVSTLQYYLIKNGNPSKWNMLILCERCSEAVENAKGIYQEIVEASRIFKAVKGEIVETVKRSCRRHRKENALLSQCEWQGEGDKFTELTRQFIFNNNYGSSSDPFVDGDKAAKEFLARKKVRPKPAKSARSIPAIAKKLIKTEPQEDLPPPKLQRYDYHAMTKREPCEYPSVNPAFLQDPNDFEVDIPPDTTLLSVLTTELEENIRLEQENHRGRAKKTKKHTESKKKTTKPIASKKKKGDPLEEPTPVIRRLRRFACHYPGCSKIYTTKTALTAHIMYHRGDKPFKCTWPGCPWRFTRADTLRRHYRVNHIPEGQWTCQFCKQVFHSRRDYLRKHYKDKHAEEVLRFGGVDALLQEAEKQS